MRTDDDWPSKFMLYMPFQVAHHCEGTEETYAVQSSDLVRVAPG
jgi:hypothetical protein